MTAKKPAPSKPPVKGPAVEDSDPITIHPATGIASFEIGGKRRTARLTFEAIAEVELQTGRTAKNLAGMDQINLNDPEASEMTLKLTAGEIVTILTEALRAQEPTIEREDVQQWLNKGRARLIHWTQIAYLLLTAALTDPLDDAAEGAATGENN